METILALISALWISFLSLIAPSYTDWLLIVCKSSDDELTCFENLYVESGYKSKNECLDAGLILQEEKGFIFECGRNCELISGESNYSCDVLCDKTGCG